MSQRLQDFSIELDCPPGSIRPNDLIDGVLRDSGIEPTDFETGAPFFGHQVWILKEEANKDAIFTASKPTFKERITALYHSGRIRYGTW